MNDNRSGILILASLLGKLPRLILSAALPIVLTPVLTLASPAVAEPASRKVLGVYGDWTAYLLQDGELQVCYAETKLIPAPEADPLHRDVRLQVSNRTFDGGTAFIHFTPVRTMLSGSYVVSIRFPSGKSFWIDNMPDSSGEFIQYPSHTDAVEIMTRGEIMKLDAELLTDPWTYGESKDTVPLGSYSLHGFIDTYDAVGQSCPDPASRMAQTDPQPVTIGDVAVVEGPPTYYEFSLTGPFFEANQADMLTIRGIPPEPGGRDPLSDIIPEEGDSPEYRFLYDTRQWEFYRDGRRLDVFDNIDRDRMSGVCLDPESKRLKLFFSGSEGGGGAAHQYTGAVYYDPADTDIKLDMNAYPVSVDTPVLYACSETESLWNRGEPFLPCRCAGVATNKAYYATLGGLVSDIEKAGRTGNGSLIGGVIDNDTLSALLARTSRLEPFMRWDVSSGFDIQQLESPKFAILKITYFLHDKLYGSFSRIFVRRLTDDVWTLVNRYEFHLSGYIQTAIYGFLDDDTVDLQMCVKDCDSHRHSETDRKQMNIKEWLKKTAEEGMEG